MARVIPFRALRFASLEDLNQKVVADPAALWQGGRVHHAGDDPHHVQRLYDAPDPWAALDRWRNEGAVVEEPPALYLVETRPADRFMRVPPVRFLLGAMDSDGPVRGLEHTPDRTSAPPVEAVPVVAADDHHVLRSLFEDVVADNFPVWESVVGDQRLRLWRLSGGGLIRRIRNVLDEVPVRPHGRLPERGRFLAAIVPLSEPGLQLLPYHRGIRGLSTFSAERFLALVTDYARVYELEQRLDEPGGLNAAMERLGTLATGQHAVLLVLPQGQGRLLRFRQVLELSEVRNPPPPTLRSLDLALLNALVLRTVLGIADPEAPGHPNVFPTTSLEDLVHKVSSGTFQAGFALNPPPVWELRAVMEAAQSLPPRTMRLWPVPPAGLLFLDPRQEA